MRVLSHSSKHRGCARPTNPIRSPATLCVNPLRIAAVLRCLAPFHRMNTKTTYHPLSPRVGLIACLATLAFALGPVRAQTTPPPRDAAADDTITLTPFTVSTERDNGFVAASSLAGGRIATALKDTPVAYSVITAEFLDAFNLTDVAQAAVWTVNSSSDVGDNTGAAFGSTNTSTLKLRGTSVNAPTRNFFPYVITPDSYNLDRVDFARGPNAVLFGAGGIGGTLNSVTKQALTNKDLTSVRVQAGSWEKLRFTGDINRPFNRNKGAVRINALHETADTWRENEWSEKWGTSIAVKYNLTPKLSVRLEGEMGKRKEAKALTAMRDRLSSWDGVTTFNGQLPVALTQAQRAAAGVAGPTAMRWVQNPAFASGTLQNFGNLYTTEALGQNGTLANTGRINGVPIITPGFSLNNTAVVDDYTGIPGDRWAAATRGSPFFKIPTREQTPLWTSKVPTYEEEGKDLAAYINYNASEHLFIEIAGDMNTGDKIGNTAARRGLEELFIDINQTLPDGSRNANFLHPYTEFMEYRNIRNDDVKNVRAQVVYSRAFDKGLFNGKLNLSGMGGVSIERNVSRARTLLLPLTTARVGAGTAAVNFTGLDGRTWVDNDEYSQFGVYTRLYLDQPDKNYQPAGETPLKITNPVTGASETITPQWMYDTRRVDNNRDGLRKYKFFQTAANLDLFKNRLVLIGAFRRDLATIQDQRVVQPGDEKVGWDGNSITFRPPAPGDYFGLTYFPKNAAGVITGPAVPANTRPRTRINGVNVRQPQYANDRFQDDFDSPVLTPDVNTFTAGGVVNLKPWLGVYANKSRTFSLTPPQQQVDGTLSPSTASEGKDYGIRFTLPNGRLAVSLGAYTSFQSKESYNVQFNFKDSYNIIAAAPVVGDLSPNGRNVRDVAAFPDNVYSTRTRSVDGYEIDITANLTPNWRLMLNGGKTVGNYTNAGADIISYFKTQDATTRLILKDAGVIINANNDASIDPLLNDPTLINTTRVLAAVNAWNNLIDIVQPSIIAGAGSQAITGNSKWVGNLATDYRVRTGWFKGLRVGAGINYRGPMVLGYRTADTILDPSDPTRTIPAPNVLDTVMSPKQIKTVGSLSYTIKLKDRRSLVLDLNIDNLLDDQKVIYSTAFGGQGATYVRPRTTISSPARVTVPGLYSYVLPRNYTLSARLNF